MQVLTPETQSKIYEIKEMQHKMMVEKIEKMMDGEVGKIIEESVNSADKSDTQQARVSE